MSSMAKIVVFEGPDKVGKETQSKLLAKALLDAGLRVTRVEPTKEFAIGKKLIYSMLDSGAAKRHPNAFQLVQFMNRMYFQYVKLPELMIRNDVVLCDRWALSGFIYGHCEGINSRLNGWMYERAHKPDLTLVFSGTSYRRSTGDDSYEKDTDLQARVKKMYSRAGIEREGHVLVNNVGTVEEIHDDIIEILDEEGLLPSECRTCSADWNESCDAGLHS
jgi:thymidylate kinase